jgi:hypothetical protein
LAFDVAMLTLQEPDRTPIGLKLATAADAIEQMADVFAARADEFFSGWHRQSVSHEGPILDDDLFAEFVRQSFHLDLDGLVGVPELYVRSDPEKSYEDAESLVGEVSKETALLLAGAELEPAVLMDELEYDEAIGAWAMAIALWMQQQKLERVGLTVVKGWLAVLLDEGFAMDRLEGSDFYRSSGILVALKREEIAIAC